MDPRDLYGLPLDRFVPERASLAKALRKDGRRDEAARVDAMRKPSVAAWAVNQLVRTQGRAVSELYAAGDAARHAQAQLLAGRTDGKALRDAMARERAAVNKLLGKARGLLSSEGHELSSPILERVSETLHAAALDEEARAQVKDGCLNRELRHVGLGSDGGFVPPPKAARGGRSKGAPSKSPRASKRDEGKQADRLRAAREADVDRLRAAREADADARRLAERTVRELASARERRERAAASLQEADEALAAAERRAEEAQRERESAQKALERLRR